MLNAKKYILDTVFNGATTWYMGLISDSGFTALDATDTMSSHAGWNEDTNYTEPNRPTLSFASASGNSITLTSSVSFTGSGVTTIKGGFTTSDNTKSGDIGTLISEGLFDTGDKPIDNGYILNASVTYTIP